MKIILKIIFSVFFLNFSIGIFSQNSNMFFERITVEEGLVNSTVKAIYQDKHGFLWFGTKNGICRYDGFTYKYFNKESKEKNGISENYIVCFEEVDDQLFIGTFSSGISIFDYNKESFINISLIDSICSKDFPVSKILKVYNSNFIYISTMGGGLIKFDKNSLKFERISKHQNESELSSNYISDIEISRNKLFLATSGGTIDAFDLNSGKIKVYKHSDYKSDRFLSYGKVLFLLDSLLFIGTETEKLFCFNIKSMNFENIDNINSQISKTIITDIVKVNDKLVISTDGSGLYFYDIYLKNLVHIESSFSNINGLSTNAIWTLYVGKNDILWIGTFAAGVNIYKEQRNLFETFNYSPEYGKSLNNASVLDIELDNNNLLIGTDGGGMNIYNTISKTFNYYNSNTGSYPNVVKSIYKDKEGIIWVGTYAQGIFRFNDSRNFAIDSVLEKTSIWDIIEDDNSGIWFGSLYKGLFYFNKKTNQIINYRNDPENKFSLAGDIINVLFIDKNGNLWIGTDGDGISRFDRKNNIFENFKAGENQYSITNNVIRSIFQDKIGKIYFGTQGGGICILDSYKSTKFSVLQEKDGLPSNTICDIIQDASGNLWISTDKGLCKFDFKTKSVRNFDSHDGLQSVEFNYNTVCKTENDKIYFGGLKGFIGFTPKDIKKEQYKIIPKIQTLAIGNKIIDVNTIHNGRIVLNQPIYITDTLIVDEETDMLTLELGCDDFLDPLKNIYKYQLIGIDIDYKQTSAKNRYVTYTNLAGGTYKFNYSVKSQIGEWNEVKTLVIIKIPHFWERTGFIFSSVILLIGIIIFAFYFLNYTHKKRELLLEEKVKERTFIISKQNEELQIQRNELVIKHNEIQKQQEILQQSNEHVNIQNEELRAQSDMLKEINNEVMDQNHKIADQAKILKDKNTLLTRSLNYAKRIQTSMFPSEKDLQKFIDKSFLFFRPRDIVSGDFFWIRKIDDLIVFAEVDCTGHGVPGAFMSMIGNTLLNEIVVNRHITNPSDIFYNLNKELLAIFNIGNFDTEAQDEGMDLSLCVIDKKNNKFKFASAMQNVFISRENSIETFKGDIFSIGGLMSKYKEPVYNNFEFDIEPGLRLIFTSDGFIDQFGGEEKLKFGVDRFEKLLHNNSSNAIYHYNESLNQTLQKWLDGYDQLDDILVVGIEF